MSKFRLGLSVVFMAVMTIIMTVQPIAAQGCFDAAGAAIPCPSTPVNVPPPDRDADSVEDALDRCPDQGGDVGNQGCPLVEGTAEASTAGTVNPNRPNPTGQCSLTTYESVGVNVRETPNLNAAVITTLDPAQVYPVHATIVVDGAVWYRVDNGWVSSAAVVVDGDCAARVIEVQRAVLQLDAGGNEEGLAGIIFPETECFEIFNGIRICQTVLSAAIDEGDSTAGKWDVNLCGFGPSGVICTLVSFTIPEDPTCPPEFCEPVPPSGGSQGGGSGGNGGGGQGGGNNDDDDDEGNAAPMCVDILKNLAAASNSAGVSPVISTEQTADGSVRFSVNSGVVDPQPQPCLVHFFAPQPDEEVDGSIPVDMVTVQVELLPAVTPDGSSIPFFEINVADVEGMPHVRVFNGVSTTPNGNTCVPMVQGDFTYCSNE